MAASILSNSPSTPRLAVCISKRSSARTDCGRPINPTGVISQINGGILQGSPMRCLSSALWIATPAIFERGSGDLQDPGAREVPEIEIALVENYIAQSSTDAAGIGESCRHHHAAAAIGNAFYNATRGAHAQDSDDPANVLTALGKVQGEVQA